MLSAQYILVGFVLSAIGSVPIGLITLTIMERTVHHGSWSGVAVAMGATVAEFVYTFIALKFLTYFMAEVQVDQGIRIASFIIFITLGLFFFLRSLKPRKKRLLPQVDGQHWDFFRGVVIGFMNMLIIPYWIVIGTMLESKMMSFSYNYLILFFSTGAALGAFAVFLCYIKLVKLVMARMEKAIIYTDRIVGTLFFTLSLIQLYNLMS